VEASFVARRGEPRHDAGVRSLQHPNSTATWKSRFGLKTAFNPCSAFLDQRQPQSTGD
jgi:hypothetical protein